MGLRDIVSAYRLFLVLVAVIAANQEKGRDVVVVSNDGGLLSRCIHRGDRRFSTPENSAEAGRRRAPWTIVQVFRLTLHHCRAPFYFIYFIFKLAWAAIKYRSCGHSYDLLTDKS